MKKQELRRDPFRDNIVKGVQYFNDNTATVFKISIIVVLSVIGISYYNYLGNLKVANSSHLSGRAQNIFINGDLDEAIVKFERVLEDYPNTPGAVQSMVYLLNDAISNNELNKINELLSENIASIDDPIILSEIYKLRGDVSLEGGDLFTAFKYYKKAKSILGSNSIKTKYQLNMASTLLAQNKYNEVVETLREIIDNVDVGFTDKNRAEELLAFTKHKMGI